MLLTIDLGNTSTKLGIYENGARKCFATYDHKPEDCGLLIKNFLYRNNLKEEMIDDTIVSCVVPSLTRRLSTDIYELTGRPAHFIDPRNYYGLKIDIPNVDELGSDLLVMCAYAYQLYHEELFVISMGTATVISHVTREGVFKHCIIAPGFGKIAETLWGNAAKLPEFQIKRTRTFLADNTVDAMNVGIYQGYIGSLRYMLAGLRTELGVRPRIVACGGFGKEVVKDIKEVEYYEADMVSSGLNYIYERFLRK